MSSRVVITGIGALTCAGHGRQGLWEGIRVEITHDLELHWPVIGGFVGKYIVGLFFIHHIATLTLAGLKRKVENMSSSS